MKKRFCALLAAAMLLSLIGCGGAGSSGSSEDAGGSGSAPPSASASGSLSLPQEDGSGAVSAPGEDMAPGSGAQSSAPAQTPPETEPPVTPPASQSAAGAASTEEAPRILIAYFTWAENTHVEDPAAVDVDATTSASVLLPGNAAKMAEWIRQEVGGELFSIRVEEPYSSDYDACLDRAAEEKAANARPALTGQVADMSQYDVVFIGFPNWWYTVPMAVLSFVDAYDFSGKTVVPFVTHGTGGLSATVRDLTAALAADVTVLEPIGVYRPEVDASQGAVQAWARELDLEGR